MAQVLNHDDQTKKFLEEASTLVQLINLVDRYNVGQEKLDECYKTKPYNEIQRLRRPARASRVRPDGHNDPLSRLTHGHESGWSRKRDLKKYLCAKQIRISKCKLENLQPNLYESNHINDCMNMETKKQSQRPQHCTSRRKKTGNVSSKTTKREIRRQRLSNMELDGMKIMKYMRKHSLRNLISLNEHDTGSTPEYSKRSKTIENVYNLSDSHLLNIKPVKRSSKKRAKAKTSCGDCSKKSINKKPTLRLMLELQFKPNSDTINLQIKTERKTHTSNKSDPDVLGFRLPLSADQINKLLIDEISEKFSTPCNDGLALNFPMQTSNEREMQLLKQQQIQSSNIRDAPYTKTHAVYNVHNVAPVLQPRTIHSFKSNFAFNMNIGKGSRTAKTMSTDDTGTINTQSGRLVGKPCQVRYKSKVNLNSGLSSLQQSFSLDRRNPEPVIDLEPCDCEPFECDPRLLNPEDLNSTICDTCCQAEEEEEDAQYHENYATLIKRTKQRIMDRVANVSHEATSMIFQPRLFMRRMYDKLSCINNKVEQQQKDVGSCTCSPFIETDQVIVQEGNVEPECSFLKRLFGGLLFNDKCIVCTEAKKIGTKFGKLKSFECGPDICIESSGIFSCIKKICGKCKKKKKKKKAKKSTPFCTFLTSIFTKKKKDDKRKLLKRKGKKRKRQKDGDDGRKKGKAEATELERNARKGLQTGRRHFRKATRRIRERYYRNKKLAEQQKGQYACDFYLMSLRNKPCLWVYYMCPFCYPHCLQALHLWRQVSDLLLFFVAILVWSPCILAAEFLKVMACNMCV